jgi:hypothetical protein
MKMLKPVEILVDELGANDGAAAHHQASSSLLSVKPPPESKQYLRENASVRTVSTIILTIAVRRC